MGCTVLIAGTVHDIYVAEKFTRATLAYSEYKGSEQGRGTTYLDCVAFGNQKDSLAQVPKGKTIQVLSQRSPEARAFEIKKGEREGEWDARPSVIVDRWEYVGFREDTDASDDDEGAPAEEAPRERSGGGGNRTQGSSAGTRSRASEPAPPADNLDEGYTDPFENRGRSTTGARGRR